MAEFNYVKVTEDFVQGASCGSYKTVILFEFRRFLLGVTCWTLSIWRYLKFCYAEQLDKNFSTLGHRFIFAYREQSLALFGLHT